MKKLCTILLIDDDLICCYLNQQLLEEMQISDNIICFTNGEEALDYFERAYCSTTEDATILPDLIILDLNMPGLGGFQVLDQLNEMNESKALSLKKVIILSTSMHPMDQERARNYEVFDYLVKPLTETKIKKVIDRFLHSQQSGSKIQNQVSNPQVVKDRYPKEKPAAEGVKKKEG